MSQSSPKYKLTYFNFRSLAEPVRYLLSYVGEDFEDVRIEMEDWEAGKIDKTQYPHSRLPILEEKLPNGETVVLTQSFCMVRYLGKKYNLVGDNLLEETKGEEYSDCIKDMLVEIEALFSAEGDKKAEVKKSLLTQTIPRYYTVFENNLRENKKRLGGKPSNGVVPLIGKNLMWIDIHLAHYSEMFDEFLESNFLDNYPLLKEHQAGVFALPKIKEWIEKRPVTKY